MQRQFVGRLVPLGKNALWVIIDIVLMDLMNALIILRQRLYAGICVTRMEAGITGILVPRVRNPDVSQLGVLKQGVVNLAK